MNVIAKPYDLAIDIMNITPIRNDKHKSILGDSLVFNISLLQNGIAKDLTDCKIDMITTIRLMDGQMVRMEHLYEDTTDGKIEIVNSLEGKIRVYPKSAFTKYEGACIFEIVIRDLNEKIYTPQIIWRITKSLSNEIVESVKDEVGTIAELKDILDKYYGGMGGESDNIPSNVILFEDWLGNEIVGIDNGEIPPTVDTTPPNNITNLTASNILQTSLSLLWTASTSSDVVSYDIYNGNMLIGNTTSSNYNVVGLTAETQYIFTIKAKDKSGNIASGESVIIKTLVNQTDISDEVYVENGHLVMPIKRVPFLLNNWSVSNSFTNENYIVIMSNAINTNLFDTSNLNNLVVLDSIPYTWYNNLGTTNNECFTINNAIYVKTSIVNGSDVSTVLNYLQNTYDDIKLKLNNDYKTYTISSNIGNVSTRETVNNDGQYFKCTLLDGLGMYTGGAINQYNSLGYDMQPGYSWTHIRENIKINSDGTLEMVVPYGTFATIDTTSVITYLSSKNIKIYY